MSNRLAFWSNTFNTRPYARHVPPRDVAEFPIPGDRFQSLHCRTRVISVSDLSVRAYFHFFAGPRILADLSRKHWRVHIRMLCHEWVTRRCSGPLPYFPPSDALSPRHPLVFPRPPSKQPLPAPYAPVSGQIAPSSDL